MERHAVNFVRVDGLLHDVADLGDFIGKSVVSLLLLGALLFMQGMIM